MGFQENSKIRKSALLTPTGQGRGSGIVFFSISFVLHGLFFFSLIFLQEFNLPKPLPSVIQIDLVSFTPEPLLEQTGPEAPPAESKENSEAEGLPIEPKPVEKKIKKIATIKPEISLKTKPKNLKDLMAAQAKKKKTQVKEIKKKPVEKKKVKSTVDADATLEKAREDLEKKVDAQNQDKIEQALSRLQKRVKAQGGSKDRHAKGKMAGAGKKGFKPIDMYNLVIGTTIEQNWVFNDILARMDQDLEVIILIKILKNGEIRDIIYETRSGNRYLDESAKKAVMKINPLPALPPGMRSYDLGLIFTPKGLK